MPFNKSFPLNSVNKVNCAIYQLPTPRAMDMRYFVECFENNLHQVNFYKLKFFRVFNADIN